MKLIKPTEKNRNIVLKFKEDMMNKGEVINGGARLMELDFDEWIRHLKLLQNEATCPEGLVPSCNYIYVDDDETKVFGIIDLRKELNDYLLNYGGHIGYSVAPDERRKGYAGAMLKAALEIYKNEGYGKVLITCNKNNLASKKTILSQNGIFEDERNNGDETYLRFWFSL